MAYSHTTWLQLTQQLAQRLGDSSLSYVFWTKAELQVCLAEAMRTWSAITEMWRGQWTITTVAGTDKYYLPTELPSLRPYTVKDQELVVSLQYSLIEGVNTGNAWAGTDRWTLTTVTNALQRRRNQFLRDSGLVLTSTSTAVGPLAATARVTLPDSVSDIRRVVWANSGVFRELFRTDPFELSTFKNTWAAAAATTPDTYSIIETAPTTLQIEPNPSVPGTLEYLSINMPADLNPGVGAGVLINVPDDYTPFVRWGALADLLGTDGPARDLQRAAFCQAQYDMGVQLARQASSVVGARIGTKTVPIMPLQQLDREFPGWQTTPGPVVDIATAGVDLIFVRRVPDGAYTLTLDVVQSATPVPQTDGTMVQIGREHLEPILQYAEALAVFKQGGEEFRHMSGMIDSFMATAASVSYRQNANAIYQSWIKQASQAEYDYRPLERGEEKRAAVSATKE